MTTPHRQANALARVLHCTWCDVNPGAPCREWDLPIKTLHSARIETARELLDTAEMSAVLTGTRAAALREAADQLDRDGMKRLSARTVKQWLRARADQENSTTETRDA